MKCKYNHCPNNNEVEKEVAIKEGNSYYCKECFEEKSQKRLIESYYLENMPQATLSVLRKVINQLIYTNKYETEYILFILKKIHNNNLKINNPFGLVNYCNDGRNIGEWNKKKINKEFQNVKDKIVQYDNNELDYKYKPVSKRWSDII